MHGWIERHASAVRNPTALHAFRACVLLGHSVAPNGREASHQANVGRTQPFVYLGGNYVPDAPRLLTSKAALAI
jgi:hypothetical protein